jgi:hypothetical protein
VVEALWPKITRRRSAGVPFPCPRQFGACSPSDASGRPEPCVPVAQVHIGHFAGKTTDGSPMPKRSKRGVHYPRGLDEYERRAVTFARADSTSLSNQIVFSDVGPQHEAELELNIRASEKVPPPRVATLCQLPEHKRSVLYRWFAGGKDNEVCWVGSTFHHWPDGARRDGHSRCSDRRFRDRRRSI